MTIARSNKQKKQKKKKSFSRKFFKTLLPSNWDNFRWRFSSNLIEVTEKTGFNLFRKLSILIELTPEKHQTIYQGSSSFENEQTRTFQSPNLWLWLYYQNNKSIKNQQNHKFL